jgi:hypothetical protein
MRKRFLTTFYILLVCLFSAVAFEAQVQSKTLVAAREITAFTFPLDRTIPVTLSGSPSFARVGGEAKVERTVREGTKIKYKINSLPAVLDLGGLYTTYVMWAISADGTAAKLTEIKSERNGTGGFSGETITPLSTFGLIVTAEPHGQVRQPCRMIIVQSFKPVGDLDKSIQGTSVTYSTNNSDFFTDEKIPDSAGKAYRKKPLKVLGAERALSLAKFAGAEQDATDSYNKASQSYESMQAEISRKSAARVIEQAATLVIDLAAKAESEAVQTREIRQRSRAEAKRENALRDAQQKTIILESKGEDLASELDRERRGRARAENDLSRKERDYDELEKESVRLRTENSRAKARIEQLERERNTLQKRLELVADLPLLKTFFAGYAKVRETRGGLIITLPETLWQNGTDQMSPAVLGKIQPALYKIVEKKGFLIILTTRGKGITSGEAENLTASRLQVLSDNLTAGGAEKSRLIIDTSEITAREEETSDGAELQSSSIKKTKIVRSGTSPVIEIELRLLETK